MKNLTFYLWLLAVIIFPGCSRDISGEEAGNLLTAPQKWKLKEVVVNGKPVYRDGKSIGQFGEISFGRYMEEVSFSRDGLFRGAFSDGGKEMVLKWNPGESEVVVSDSVPNSGKWRIPYLTLTRRSFEMSTETSAYDPPNITRIRLRFEQ